MNTTMILLRKITFLMYCLTTSTLIFGQDNKDTYTTLKKGDIRYRGYGKPRAALRLGTGIQKKGYIEVGISSNQIFNGTHFHGSKMFYTSFEWIHSSGSNDKNIYGGKIGAEITDAFTALGIETKFLNDGTHKDFMITPKIGLAPLGGIIILYYGYNISTNKYPFDKVGRHQFSVLINLNKSNIIEVI